MGLCKTPEHGFLAVIGPDGYAMLMSSDKGRCLMLSLPGVYCCVHASGTGTHCWVVWRNHCIQMVDFCSFVRRCRRWQGTGRVEGFSAVWPAVVDQSNTDAEGTAAFRTLVNFLVRCQEDYFRLANLAFPLRELELFYSAQRGQCLCWFCSVEGLWEKGNIYKI